MSQQMSHGYDGYLCLNIMSQYYVSALCLSKCLNMMSQHNVSASHLSNMSVSAFHRLSYKYVECSKNVLNFYQIAVLDLQSIFSLVDLSLSWWNRDFIWSTMRIMEKEDEQTLVVVKVSFLCTKSDNG